MPVIMPSAEKQATARAGQRNPARMLKRPAPFRRKEEKHDRAAREYPAPEQQGHQVTGDEAGENPGRRPRQRREGHQNQAQPVLLLLVERHAPS